MSRVVCCCLNFGVHLWHGLEEVLLEGVVRHLEDRGLLVLVDGDDAAWNAALEHARKSVVANFEELGRGLFAARFDKPVAGVPLLFPETLVGLGLEGGPAVLLPNEHLLVVCGLNDEQADALFKTYHSRVPFVKQLTEQASKSAQENGFVYDYVIRLRFDAVPSLPLICKRNASW